jgi:hypothetical protein
MTDRIGDDKAGFVMVSRLALRLLIAAVAHIMALE